MKIALIGSGLANLLIAAKLANEEDYHIDIYEKNHELGGRFRPVEIIKNSRNMVTYNTFIDEDNLIELLAEFDIKIPLNSTFSLHRLYAINDLKDTYNKYRNVNETVQSLKIDNNQRNQFKEIYQDWLVNYNSLKAYATNDVTKEYYQNSLLDIFKNSYRPSFYDDARRIRNNQLRILYSISPITTGINPRKLNRQNQYLSILEHKRGMAYFNKANTDLYDKIIQKINNSENVKIIYQTVLNVFQNRLIIDGDNPQYDLIIDGTTNYTFERRYQEIGLNNDVIALVINKTYHNMPTNQFIITNELNSQIKNKKFQNNNSIFIHNPYRMQTENENSILIINYVGHRKYTKLEIQNQLLPMIEAAGFYEISKRIIDVKILENFQNIKSAEEGKNIYKNKLMIESAVNENLMFSSSSVGYGPQLNNRLKTALKILRIIEERKNNENNT